MPLLLCVSGVVRRESGVEKNHSTKTSVRKAGNGRRWSLRARLCAHRGSFERGGESVRMTQVCLSCIGSLQWQTPTVISGLYETPPGCSQTKWRVTDNDRRRQKYAAGFQLHQHLRTEWSNSCVSVLSSDSSRLPSPKQEETEAAVTSLP